MSGIDASKVYLPSPVQTATTGAVAIAPVGTSLPATASEALGSAWDNGGYIGDAGISISTNKGVTTIKDWSQGAVRKALSDFDGTISVPKPKATAARTSEPKAPTFRFRIPLKEIPCGT